MYLQKTTPGRQEVALASVPHWSEWLVPDSNQVILMSCVALKE